MAISCECDFDSGTLTVGDPKEVTCRNPRKCFSCGKQINTNDKIYRWSMYNYDTYQTVAPYWLCEECGDMALNLLEYNYCFSLGESIRDQWVEYLYETNDPAYELIKANKCQT